MNISKITYFFIVAMLILPSCSKSSDKPKYKGFIDDKFIQFLSNVNKGETIILTADGGNEKYAITAAKIIINKKLNVIVQERCISACVDFILPAFNKIEFYRYPSILLHGNTHLTNLVMKQNKTQNDKISPYTKNECLANEKQLINIWETQGTNYKIITDNLMEGGVKYIFVNETGCGSVIYNYAFWFPTSPQLKQIFGDKISGNVCADSQVCIDKILIPASKKLKYKKIKIGDKVYDLKN